MDAVVVGGGVIGMLCARELNAAGASVTLLERQKLGQESSWAGGGILSPINPWQVPSAVTDLCRWSQAAYPQLAQDLLRSTGIDPEWEPSGMLIRLADEGSALDDWAGLQGLPIEYLDAEGVASKEPGLTRLAGGIAALLPQVAHIRNPRLLVALAADLERRGVPVMTDQEVQGIDVAAGRVRSVRTAVATYRADRVIVAAGAWSGRVAEMARVTVDVEPVRGQMLLFAAASGVLRHIVLEKGRYLIPRRDGRILAGSTVEHAGFEKCTTAEAGKELADFAYGLLPSLRQYPIEKHWAGLRPGSPQGVPFIGRHPAIKDLYFNCGHFRNGLVMGPAAARLLADMMLDRPPIVSPVPYQIPNKS